MLSIEKIIQDAKTIILSTHMQPDGDGIGSQLGLFWALKKIGKNVRILNVDPIPEKYSFLDPQKNIQNISGKHDPVDVSDLALIFDTNDSLLLGDLWDTFKEKCKKVLFVDHHPSIEARPAPEESLLDITSSSTGQIVFDLIEKLKIPLDADIAKSLYCSIVFDTHNFRYIRNSYRPHEIAATLLKFDVDAHTMHRKIFGNYTPEKIKFLTQILGKVSYEFDGRLAWLRMSLKEMAEIGVEQDETRDVIDLLMNISTVEAAAVFREEENQLFKVSFRSKGDFPVNKIAEKLGGGGHLYASGAYIKSDFKSLIAKVKTLFSEQFK